MRAGREGDNRGWDGWMASLTQCTWVLVNCGSWWWTGRPGVLWFMGSQRVGHDWATELNWTESLVRKDTMIESQKIMPARTFFYLFSTSQSIWWDYHLMFEENSKVAHYHLWTKFLSVYRQLRKYFLEIVIAKRMQAWLPDLIYEETESLTGHSLVIIKNLLGNSLVVQWLGLGTFAFQGPSVFTWLGT